ncbi:hypothetical protein ANN_05737 [Periplaneta americana]|uniref:Uncharacterized protein n=1 Tax=Periplaneta americana TaxID=6978 RepID=A0ABQ8TCI6_PERAM|nr:hypothetical protein ANN_05737 [Periplaneta americana]
MSPGSSIESYPAFAGIGLKENPGKNVNQQAVIYVCLPPPVYKCELKTNVFNDAVSTTRLFSVDEIGDSDMIFGDMSPRIRHRLPCIHITVGENLGKNPTRSAEDAPFSIKSFLCYCYPPLDFVAAYSTSQVFEAVHLLYCLI